MTSDNPNIIFVYTDADALRDGVLVNVRGIVSAPINRATWALFGEYTRPIWRSPLTGFVTDIGRLSRLGEVVAERIRKGELQEGWVVLEDEGRTIWCMPNETTYGDPPNDVPGWTLVFPDDY